MARLLKRAELYATLPRNVLLIGPTGVGKGFVARVLHELGGARGGFVTMTGGELTDSLVHSQLFGHERGAFTGAQERHVGAFAQAERGTLFLDEIHHWSRVVQTALLRPLSEREFTPLRSERKILVTCKVIFASTRTVDQLVSDGLLPDLRYRLPHLRLEIPPLCERRADILPVATDVLERSRRQLGFALPSRLESGAVQALLGYSWPGNVRELEQAVDAGVIEAAVEGSKELCARHLRPEIAAEAVSLTRLDEETHLAGIAWAMEQTGGNSCAAARLLGVHRNTMTNWRRGRAAAGDEEPEPPADVACAS